MSDSFKVKNRLNITPKSSAGSVAGDLSVASSDSNKLMYHNGSAESQVITASQVADLAYDPTISGLAATDVKGAIDEVQSNVATHIADTAGAHAASAIAVTPAGNLAATDVQAALTELQGDIDTQNTLADGKIYIGNGSNVATEVTPTGDVTIANDGTTAIAAGAIVDADVNASAALAHSKMAALTASRAMVTDGSGVASVATTTAAEIEYVNGVTSAIQTQLDAKIAKSLVTTKGDIVAATANATPARVAVGADGLFLKADSGTSAGVSWASPAGANLAVRSVSSTDSALTSDDVIILSGASFTLTLFAAAGNSGKVLRLIHNGTSSSQVYTIDGNAAETIGGATTLQLKTNGHCLTIVSDGSNWQILSGAPHLYQRKALTADISADTTSVTDLAFSNLVVGRQYRVSMNINFSLGNANQLILYIRTGLSDNHAVFNHVAQGTAGVLHSFISSVFIATGTSLTVEFDEVSTAILKGDGTFNQTWVLLEELPTHVVTTGF